ncbi:MAG: hypothetical protein HZB51_14410 [Chloroflexi bacterium]|nr:hypothetical protein [Chloroflexota bacterium]
MSRIEVWKSNPLWQAATVDEKQRVLLSLRDWLNVFGQNDPSEQEPYLISKDELDLLVWTSTRSELDDATQFAVIGLERYFELVSYMSATKKLTAKSIADKLRQ